MSVYPEVLDPFLPPISLGTASGPFLRPAPSPLLLSRFLPNRTEAGVVRRRMRGETTREIAKAEGIARNTVIRILSLPEVREAIARSRGLILARADEMSERLVQMALGETSKGDRQALVDILRGIGVLTAKLEVEETIPQERTYLHRYSCDSPRVSYLVYAPLFETTSCRTAR